MAAVPNIPCLADNHVAERKNVLRCLEILSVIIAHQAIGYCNEIDHRHPPRGLRRGSFFADRLIRLPKPPCAGLYLVVIASLPKFIRQSGSYALPLQVSAGLLLVGGAGLLTLGRYPERFAATE